MVFHGYHAKLTLALFLFCVNEASKILSARPSGLFPYHVLQVSQLSAQNVHVLSVYDVPKLSDTTHNTQLLASSLPSDDRSFPAALKQ